MLLNKKQIEKINLLIIEVGKLVENYYHQEQDLHIEMKADKSPVTIADKMASNMIISELNRIIPSIECISEEEDEATNLDILKRNNNYFLIDPIDGTRSFIKKDGDFTINIALISNNYPVFGAIYHPLLKALYYTGDDFQARRRIDGRDRVIDLGSKFADFQEGVKIVIPTRPIKEEAKRFYSLIKADTMDKVASSYKFCLLAEGQYDIYANFARLFLWDVAAGHAILKATGGNILNTDGSEFIYPNNTLLNPRFISYSGTVKKSDLNSLMEKFNSNESYSF